jgi:hypothetical protein
MHVAADPFFCLLQGHSVKRIEGRGYLILAFFGAGYRISLQDMQLIMDVCPLRVDALFVREPLEDDFVSNPDANPSSKAARGSGSPSALAKQSSAVLCVSVLDINQPVQITESEVVRVRKRSRGLLFPSFFGGGSSSSGSSKSS